MCTDQNHSYITSRGNLGVGGSIVFGELGFMEVILMGAKLEVTIPIEVDLPFGLNKDVNKYEA